LTRQVRLTRVSARSRVCALAQTPQIVQELELARAVHATNVQRSGFTPAAR
jgi:hypothetical protein